MSAPTIREARARRKKRIRGKVTGTAERPRLSVFRSNKAIYAQVVDDLSGRTVVSARSAEVAGKGLDKSAVARKVGELVASRAKEKNIEQRRLRPLGLPLSRSRQGSRRRRPRGRPGFLTRRRGPVG